MIRIDLIKCFAKQIDLDSALPTSLTVKEKTEIQQKSSATATLVIIHENIWNISYLAPFSPCSVSLWQSSRMKQVFCCRCSFRGCIKSSAISWNRFRKRQTTHVGQSEMEYLASPFALWMAGHRVSKLVSFLAHFRSFSNFPLFILSVLAEWETSVRTNWFYCWNLFAVWDTGNRRFAIDSRGFFQPLEIIPRNFSHSHVRQKLIADIWIGLKRGFLCFINSLFGIHSKTIRNRNYVKVGRLLGWTSFGKWDFRCKCIGIINYWNSYGTATTR